jgi:hypothetical protein
LCAAGGVGGYIWGDRYGGAGAYGAGAICGRQRVGGRITRTQIV